MTKNKNSKPNNSSTFKKTDVLINASTMDETSGKERPTNKKDIARKVHLLEN